MIRKVLLFILLLPIWTTCYAQAPTVDSVFFREHSEQMAGKWFMTVDTSTFAGVMNNAFCLGYNISWLTPWEHALWFNIENNFYNEVSDDTLMEFNLNYIDDEGNWLRPIQIEIDKETNFVEVYFYTDIFRLIGDQFSVYPDEITQDGNVSFNNVPVLVSKGGFNIGGGGLGQRWGSNKTLWGMDVDEETQGLKIFYNDKHVAIVDTFGVWQTVR